MGIYKEKIDKNGKDNQSTILDAARNYLMQSGNAARIPVEEIEQNLGVEKGRGLLEIDLKTLEQDEKIEIVAKDENGFAKAIKLAYRTIRNSDNPL